MLTFNQEAKDFYVARLEAHQKADEIIQGTGWENGKGCAVGCTLHNYSHEAYETELGIPRILAKLEDKIFEGMNNENAKQFPLKFLKAVPIGVDLKDVFKKFFIWMLTDAEYGVIKFVKTDQQRKVIQDVSDLLQKSLLQEVTAEEFRTARYAAADAYASSADASAAASSAAASSAAAAASADADAYAYAAYAPADAASSAAVASAAAYAYAAYAPADAASSAARKQHFFIMGEKLIDIISETK